MKLGATVFCVILMAFCVAETNAQWVQTGGPLGGQACSIAWNGSTLFAAGASGVFRSTDFGASWTRGHKPSLYPMSLAVMDPYLFLSCEHGGLFRSSDEGLSWTYVGSYWGAWCYDFAKIGDKLFAGGRFGVYFSSDSGSSWRATNLDTTGTVNSQVIALAESGTNLFAGTYGNGIFRTSDNGASWTNVGLVAKGVIALAESDTNLFVGTESGGIFFSSNRGASWTEMKAGLPSDCHLTTLAAYENNLFAGTFRAGMFRSTDNARSWVAVDSGLTDFQVQALSVIPSGGGGTMLFAGTSGGGVFISTNNGTSWSSRPLTYVDVFGVAVSGDLLFAGSGIGGIFRSTNNGASWIGANVGLGCYFVYSFAVAGAKVFAGTAGGGVFESSNDGKAWTHVNAVFGADNIVLSLGVAFGELYAGAYTAGVYRSSDNGVTWSASGLSGHDIWFITRAEGDLWAGASDGIFRSTDKGNNWAPAGFAGESILGLAAHGDSVFVGTWNGIFITDNRGINWTVRGLAGVSVGNLVFSGTNLFATTGDGVCISADYGKSWVNVNQGLEGREAGGLVVAGGNLLAATRAGVWKRSLSEMITSVPIPTAELPTSLSLSQNYPNPFNSSTTIRYGLPERSHVSLVVFNTLGQQVTVLQNGEQEAGHHYVKFEASALPSGVYFYRLQAGGYVDTKKLLLVR